MSRQRKLFINGSSVKNKDVLGLGFTKGNTSDTKRIGAGHMSASNLVKPSILSQKSSILVPKEEQASQN